MKKLFLVLITMLMIISCQKSELTLTKNVGYKVRASQEFIVSYTNNTGGKTTIQSNSKEWSAFITLDNNVQIELVAVSLQRVENQYIIAELFINNVMVETQTSVGTLPIVYINYK